MSIIHFSLNSNVSLLLLRHQLVFVWICHYVNEFWQSKKKTDPKFGPSFRVLLCVFFYLRIYFRRSSKRLSTYLIGAFFDTRLFNVFRRKVCFRFSCYTTLNACIQQTNTDHNTEHTNHIRISQEWSGFTLFRSQHVLIDAFRMWMNTCCMLRIRSFNSNYVLHIDNRFEWWLHEPNRSDPFFLFFKFQTLDIAIILGWETIFFYYYFLLIFLIIFVFVMIV